MIADIESSPEPTVVRKTKKKKKAKVAAGAPAGGVMYFEPQQYQATVDENTQQVSLTQTKSASPVKNYAYSR